jgi:CubicO group peptidase (beta-lactamase class C family)
LSSARIDLDETRIDALFCGLDRSHEPGGVVGIAVGGRPRYCKGFGLASLDLPVALAPWIRMPIGSVTKHFTCLAFMLLSEEGLVSLEDTVGKYFSDFHATARAATVRQLMGHVSGLRDAYDIAMTYCGITHEMTAAQVLSFYRDIDDLNAPPGSRWVYNNGAYLILSAIIERVAQRSLDEVFAERIFAPLGMMHTLLRRFDTRFVPNSASLHAMGVDGGFAKGIRPVEGVGQGGIISTVEDMLRWMCHMDAPEIGTASTWTIMKSPLMLTNGRSTAYGLGLEVGSYRGFETIGHSGGVVGGNSYMLKVPAADLDIIVMANRYDVSSAQLARSVLDACLVLPERTAAMPRQHPCRGLFISRESERVVQLLAEADRQLVSLEGTAAPYIWKSERVLVPAHGFAQESVTAVTLMGDPEHPDVIQLSGHGCHDELFRHSQESDSPDSSIDGRYRSAATDTRITVCTQSMRLSASGPLGSSTYVMSPVAKGVFRAGAAGPLPMSAMVCVSAGGRTLRISTPRTQALRFEREGV